MQALSHGIMGALTLTLPSLSYCMRAKKRIHTEAAYVLHQHDFSETSLILEVFTRQFGRLALLAKGAKRPFSSFRAVLLPLQAVHIGFTMSTEAQALAVLRNVEWGGLAPMPGGASLLAGMYLNELILKLLAKEDPHPELFDGFHHTVQTLSNSTDQQAWVLRAFELQLLHTLGILPSLRQPAHATQELKAQENYHLEAANGLLLVPTDTAETHTTAYHSLKGSEWLALDTALHTKPVSAGMTACIQFLSSLSRATQRSLRLQLAGAIAQCLQQYQYAGTEQNSASDTPGTNRAQLRTRRFISELQALQNLNLSTFQP